VRYPDAGLTIVVLANRDAVEPRYLAYELASLYLPEPRLLWRVWKYFS
jgi:hypothetical protein